MFSICGWTAGGERGGKIPTNWTGKHKCVKLLKVMHVLLVHENCMSNVIQATQCANWCNFTHLVQQKQKQGECSLSGKAALNFVIFVAVHKKLQHMFICITNKT